MRIGLVATINNSGLGVLAKEFHKHIKVGIHFVVPHPSKGTHLEDVKSEYMLGSEWDVDAEGVEAFLAKKPDVVVFFEYPYNWNFVRRCHQEGIPIVWFPMIDSVGTPWMRKEKVLDKITYFISPTQFCHDTLKGEGLPSIPMPWPIDTDFYAFKQRGEGESVTFLHNAGYGGDGNRKGWDVVCRAWQQIRREGKVGNAKLIVHSLIPISSVLLEGVDFRPGEVKDPRELYAEGDVYLSPSRKEGLGLPFREAMSCGLPVIGTDIPPLNEVLKDRDFLIRYVSKRPIGVVQNGEVYEPDCDDLVQKMLFAMRCPTLAEKSRIAREIIVSDFSWHGWATVYEKVFEEIGRCSGKL